MLERNRSICAPAGMMWSVLMLSPRAIRTSPRSAGSSAPLRGMTWMLSPLITRTAAASWGEAGGTRLGLLARSSVAGTSWAGARSPSFLGSVITPAIAVAAATSLELR